MDEGNEPSKPKRIDMVKREVLQILSVCFSLLRVFLVLVDAHSTAEFRKVFDNNVISLSSCW